MLYHSSIPARGHFTDAYSAEQTTLTFASYRINILPMDVSGGWDMNPVPCDLQSSFNLNKYNLTTITGSGKQNYE